MGIHTPPHRSGILHHHLFVSVTEHSWIRFEPSPPGKLWPTPPHRCRASIRTLNGPLLGPVHVGVRSKAQVHHHRDEPGIVGCCHLTSGLHGPALNTQSPEQGGGCRCLPNFLDRLLVLASSTHGPALPTPNRSRIVLSDSVFPSARLGRLGSHRRRYRRGHALAQRLIHLSTHPEPVQ